MVTKEKDEELALFLEMRRRDKERETLPLGGETNAGSAPLSKTVSSAQHLHRTAADKFLDSENDKSDYDWLLTPPGTPLYPSLEMESQKTLMNQVMSNARPTALKSRLTNIQEEPVPKANAASKRTTLPARATSASTGNRRSSSSGLPTSEARLRPATPTARPTLPAKAKASRPSTPNSRASLPSTKPAPPPVRSLTPTRTVPRSSTPTARPSIPISKATSRSATPTRQQSNPTAAQSASVLKSATTVMKNPAPSRGSSPTVKSRPWKPNEMPGFSLDAPPNLRTTLPERPASASRGRPGSTNTQSSNEAGSNGRPRQQSCSPARGRTLSGNLSGSKISIPIKSRVQTKSSDDVNPALMGTKMVERVVNMRKLAPPKQDGHHSTNSSGKSSPLDSSGFGRSLSKKSLDMALRHMEIRRTVSGNLRPLMAIIPASSMYSVRSGGSTKVGTTSASGSPLATRSNASSEPSVNNNSFFVDGSETDAGSERGNFSPTSQGSRRCIE